MLQVLGLLLVLGIVGGAAAYTAHVYNLARASGAIQPALKAGSRVTRARTAASRAPVTVRAIIAQALADNWVAKKAHQRGQKPPAPKRARGSVLRRLVAPPGAGRLPPSVIPPAAPASPPAPPAAPAAPAAPANVRPIKSAPSASKPPTAAQPAKPATPSTPGRTPPMSSPAMAHKSPPPPDHASVIARIAGYEPQDDADLLRFMTGECSAMAGYSDAMAAVFETCVNTIGLDPASVAGLSEYATAITDAAEAMRRAHARFYSIYAEVMEAAAKGVVMPHKGRWITGQGA